MASILTHSTDTFPSDTAKAAEKAPPAVSRRLSLRAAIAVWVALSLLGWGAIAGVVWLLWR